MISSIRQRHISAARLCISAIIPFASCMATYIGHLGHHNPFEIVFFSRRPSRRSNLTHSVPRAVGRCVTLLQYVRNCRRVYRQKFSGRFSTIYFRRFEHLETSPYAGSILKWKACNTAASCMPSMHIYLNVALRKHVATIHQCMWAI
jgi:hypothetical protein